MKSNIDKCKLQFEHGSGPVSMAPGLFASYYLHIYQHMSQNHVEFSQRDSLERMTSNIYIQA